MVSLCYIDLPYFVSVWVLHDVFGLLYPIFRYISCVSYSVNITSISTPVIYRVVVQNEMSKDPALFTSFIDAASYFIYGKKPTTNMFILLELSGAIIAWDATNVKHLQAANGSTGHPSKFHSWKLFDNHADAALFSARLKSVGKAIVGLQLGALAEPKKP